MKPEPDNRAEMALCACGCGQSVKQKMCNGRVIRFKAGHHKIKDGTPKYSQILECSQCHLPFKRGSRTRFCSMVCLFASKGLVYSGRDRVYEKVDRSIFRVVSSTRLQRRYLMYIRHVCDDCGWCVYESLLEVHHVDHNRKNGELSNLALLCPTCHEVRHLLEKSGRHDPERHAKAAAVRRALGPSIAIPRGVARTTVQQLMDAGRLLPLEQETSNG